MYLFFDTETNGLPINWGAHVHDLDNWPRMLQIAWVLCKDDGTVIKQKQMMIKPEGFELNFEAARVHGFTKEKLNAEGEELDRVLIEFVSDIQEAEVIIGHNVQFDKSIVGAELIRRGMEGGYEILKEMKRVCTMNSSTKFCMIEGANGRYKWPKLQELHHKLFNAYFEDAHNAMADVQATMKCFFELKNLNVIK